MNYLNILACIVDKLYKQNSRPIYTVNALTCTKINVYTDVGLYILNTFFLSLKPLYTFRTETKKVHRFTKDLQGLQKVMVKDFS